MDSSRIVKHVKLVGVFFRLGLMTVTEYRIDFFLQLLQTAVSVATGLSVLWVITGHTENVGGWHMNELLVVMGLWFIVSGSINMVIAPSIRQFMEDHWTGTLDYLFTKPANHQFMTVSRKVQVFQIADVLIGFVILMVAIARVEIPIGPEQILMFAVAIISGAVTMYAFWIILGTLAIWTIRLENMILVFYSMFEAGRWPVAFYPIWLKSILVFVIPIAVAISIPSEALLGKLNWSTIGLCVAWSLVALTVANKFYDYGVKKKYMGASA